MGFGIADVYKAYADTKTEVNAVSSENQMFLFVDSRENRLYVNLDNLQNYSHCRLNIYSGLGTHVLSCPALTGSIDISFLPKGIYVAHLQTDKNMYVRKFIKM
jgi:hypothetical protein